MPDDLLAGPASSYFLEGARRTLNNLPAPFRGQLTNIILAVEEFASPEQLALVGLADRWDLSGLYHGRPLPDQSVWQAGDLPPQIFLFRQPLLAEWLETRVDLDDLIRHVTIHEAGHHFGFSDDDMHFLETTG